MPALGGGSSFRHCLAGIIYAQGAAMDNYQLLVNTYEKKAIKEDDLSSNDVAGLIIRLNQSLDELRNKPTEFQLDDKFVEQWVEAGNAKLLRVPYFVYNPYVDAQTNYEWFVKHMPYEAGAVMVGIEGAGITSSINYANEVRKFCDLVKPRWNLMIYTREGYLSLLKTWPTDVPYGWAQYPPALYPDKPEQRGWNQVRSELTALSGPANTDKVPGAWKVWRVSDRLILPGCAEPVDVDVFPGTRADLIAWINEKPPIVDGFVEEHTQPYPGVELHKVYRYNSHCFIAIIDPAGKRFEVTRYDGKTVSAVAVEKNAQIVINGGYSGRAVGLQALKGKIYVNKKQWEPWVNFTSDNQPQIHPYEARVTPYNALAGKRFIVQEGGIAPRTSAAWKEYHPRTLVGVTRDGKLIACVVDGRQGPANFGVTLYDGARIMIEFGAWQAIDLDGGGSSAMWVKDRVINSPIDKGLPGTERPVVTHIAIFIPS
jgi:hypothetical protein